MKFSYAFSAQKNMSFFFVKTHKIYKKTSKFYFKDDRNHNKKQLFSYCVPLYDPKKMSRNNQQRYFFFSVVLEGPTSGSLGLHRWSYEKK